MLLFCALKVQFDFISSVSKGIYLLMKRENEKFLQQLPFSPFPELPFETQLLKPEIYFYDYSTNGVWVRFGSIERNAKVAVANRDVISFRDPMKRGASSNSHTECLFCSSWQLGFSVTAHFSLPGVDMLDYMIIIHAEEESFKEKRFLSDQYEIKELLGRFVDSCHQNLK